eukprot:1185048-Prorocentrum_minimum.AAC.2
MLASKTAQRVVGGVYVSQNKRDQRGGALKRVAARVPRNGRQTSLRTVRTRAMDDGNGKGKVEGAFDDGKVDKLVQKPGLDKAVQSLVLRIQTSLIKGVSRPL